MIKLMLLASSPGSVDTLTIGQIISQYGYIPLIILLIGLGIYIGKIIEKLQVITKTLDAILTRLDSEFLTESEIKLLINESIKEHIDGCKN